MSTAAQQDSQLLFLPLGGAGEIGMNLNLYCYGGKWLMVDLGITFADETLPGIDVVLPDPRYIVERRDDLVGIVLTHAHEDHLGAVPYLWSRLRCPVYATPFTAAVLRRKLTREGADPEAQDMEIIEVPLGGRMTLGPFKIEFVSLTHSIPEPNGLAITTPAGTVLHTGDWKIDPDPVVGDVTDAASLERWGESGILAMVCDSTNVFREGEAGSEAEVQKSLVTLIAGYEGRGVAVACFASNVARIVSVAEAAKAAERHVALVGRSLWRITDAARETGYLDDGVSFLGDREAGALPPDKVLYLCTGCQGEPRAAMSRIASGSHPQVSLGQGDVAIFSSKIIPGNELAINRLHNRLIALGVEVVTEDDHFVHVSGHPCRDELAQMYRWIKPRIAVPVHGEARHLVEHARFARSLQVAEAPVVENGDVLQLAPGPARVVDQVFYGRLVSDGRAVVSAASPVMKTRRRMMHNGVLFVTLVLDADGRLVTDPRVRARGVFHPEGDFVEEEEEEPAALAEVAEAVRVAVVPLPPRARADDTVLEDAVKTAARRHIRATLDKRPVIELQIVRL